MNYVYRVQVEGATLTCSVCRCPRFKKTKFKFAGKWMQTLGIQFLAADGITLICERCTHLLHFADPNAIETTDD